MYAVTIVDGILEWQEHPDPLPGPGQLLVQVTAAGINGADLLQRKGFYPAPPGYPVDIPGLELAGTVVATGEGTRRFGVGDRVMAVTGGGGQAGLAVIPESGALAVPDGMAWESAGGFPEAFSTAHDALVTQAGLSAGERVLISGAAGGVGTAAVQLAAFRGAEVVASIRDTGRGDVVDVLHRLGATSVITPDEVPVSGPFDVSLELVGAPGVEQVLPHLALGGRIVVIGVGAGAKAEVNLLAVMGARASISGSTLRSRTETEKASVAAALEADTARALAEGSLVVPVAETFPMSEAQAAYDRFAAGGKVGKIVLLAP